MNYIKQGLDICKDEITDSYHKIERTDYGTISMIASDNSILKYLWIVLIPPIMDIVLRQLRNIIKYFINIIQKYTKSYALRIYDIDVITRTNNPIYNTLIDILNKDLDVYDISGIDNSKCIKKISPGDINKTITIKIDKKCYIYDIKSDYETVPCLGDNYRLNLLNIKTNIKDNLNILEQYLLQVTIDKYRYEPEKIVIYEYNNDRFQTNIMINYKKYCNCHIDNKNKLIKVLDNFMSQKCIEFDIKNGIPHKLSIMFTGSPGTGKTSFTYAIANELEWPLYIITGDVIDKIHNIKFREKSVILFDDFDTFIYPKRNNRNFNNIIHFLDGLKLHDNILVFTTNIDIKDYDKAFLRPGRIDYIHEFKTNKEVTDEICKFNNVGIKENGETSSELLFNIRNKINDT